MYCEHCGKKRNTDEKFCTECGKPYPDSKINKSNSSGMDVPLILGIISCVLIFIPIFSIPVAIVSLVMGLTKKKGMSNLIPAMISLIISIIEIIIIIFVSITLYNEIKTDISETNSEENYYYEPEQSLEGNEISGHNWIGDDGSILQLEEDQTYSWYESDLEKENNYYQGTYEIYSGNDAVSYIAKNLQEYGLTEEEQQKDIVESNHNINEYYLIILNCEKMVINGIEQPLTNNAIYYSGYYEEETNYLDLINMNTNNKAGFTKESNQYTTGIIKKNEI